MKSLNTSIHYYSAQLLGCNIMGHFLWRSSMVAVATWFVEISDVLALAWPESHGFGLARKPWLWPGLRWLWLSKILSQASTAGLGLAWPGFGSSRGLVGKFSHTA